MTDATFGARRDVAAYSMYSAEESSTFIVKSDRIWTEFEKPRYMKPHPTKKAALLLGRKEDLPSIFEKLLIKRGMGCEEINRALSRIDYVVHDLWGRDRTNLSKSHIPNGRN